MTRNSALVIAAVTAIATVVVGCGAGRPSHTVLDLVSGVDRAAVKVESADIDIGEPEARQHLVSGWYHDEQRRSDGDSFVWSRGEESVIELYLGWPRDLRLEAVVRPFQFPGAGPQTVHFEVNGRPVGETLGLEPGENRLVLDLPAMTLRPGSNRLTARYGRVDRPAEVVPGADDDRRLAVAWLRLRLSPVDASPIRVDHGWLELPAGARVDYFLDLERGDADLTIDACDVRSDSAAFLDLTIAADGDSAIRESFRCTGKNLSVPLSRVSGLVRIRLEVRPPDSDVRPSGLRIAGARVSVAGVSPVREDLDRDDPAAAERVNRPNVVVYLVDALRADRLGPYGCSRPLTPRLDAFAEKGMTFTNMTAQSSWTKAAVASIFTGVWPRVHGVNGPDDRLPDDRPTLPELLQRAGYRTGAVVANAYVGRPFGFARGFDHFEFLGRDRSRSTEIGDRVDAWLEHLPDDDVPFFLYVHTIDPHAPYAPPKLFRKRFAADVADASVGRVEVIRGLVLGTVEPTASLGLDLRQLYDAEVAANDASFGRLLDRLKALGELDETIVIFTSDHGEAFGEHATWTHGLDLHREVLAVPLIVRLPGEIAAGERVNAPVQHIDLLPSILRSCGAESWAKLPGAVIFDANGVASFPADRPIFAYLDYWGRSGASILRSGWKLIRPLSADFGARLMLYRHDSDRAESQNLANELPVRAGWLDAELGVALRQRGESDVVNVSDETRRQLEALGYMH